MTGSMTLIMKKNFYNKKLMIVSKKIQKYIKNMNGLDRSRRDAEYTKFLL